MCIELKRFCYISRKSVFVVRNVETHFPNKNVLISFRKSTYVAAMLWKNTSKENERTCLLGNYYCVDEILNSSWFYVSEALCLKISGSHLLSMITLRWYKSFLQDLLYWLFCLSKKWIWKLKHYEWESYFN